MRAFPHSHRITRSGGSLLGDDVAGGRIAAIALLGDGHPLVAVPGQLETIGAQLVVCAAAHTLGLVLCWVMGLSGAAIAGGALVLEIVLGYRLLVLLQVRRGACLV